MIVPTRAEDFAALLRGEGPRALTLPETPVATPEILTMLAELAETVGQDFHPAAWLIVESGEVVGLCSLKAPPQEGGVVEIGYGVAPSRQGRGAASRAVADVIAWALEEPEVDVVTAETLPDNIPSHRVLIRNGFAHVGERIDPEDGRVFCWRRETV
jgi:RimJ/RimL family protein N-acetyltransferase